LPILHNPHYLYERFQELYTKDPSGHTFYSDFLILLFQKLSNEQLEFKDLGDVPFFNGGLFEIEPFHSKLPFDLKISNRTFRSVFERMLEHFNFTVREDTPLDVEVAIDPEMLGRIFENLILQLERDRDLRKMTGSYYTPRVIVHFMCQQSLKEYLASESQIDPTKLEMLLEFNPPDQLEDWEVDLLKDIVSIPEARTLRDMAKRVFVLDPAVGSGAFLVGMLHEVLTLIKHMDIREHGQEYIARRNYDYELKRDIIENCLYGVDILEQAVRICELRLWLSLVVDYEKEAGEEVPPLPNLSYQVRQGDSLIEMLFGQRVRLDALTRTEKGRQLIDEIHQEKHSYFLTRNLNQKRQKELSILVKQCELAEVLVSEKRQYLATKPRLIGEMTTKEAIEHEGTGRQVAVLDTLLSSAKNAKQKAQAWLEGTLPTSSIDMNRLRQDLGIFFIWQLDFAEVFKEKEGFDVVVANPPYIRISGIAEEIDRAIREEYVSVYGNYDIYIAFIELGINLLRNNGLLTFITPNKFLTKKYANRLRPFMLEKGNFLNIVDTSQARTFDSSSVYPLVFVYRKKRMQEEKQPVKISIVTDSNFETFFKSSRQSYDYVSDQQDFKKNKNSMIDIFVNPALRRLVDRISTDCSSLGNYSRLLTGTPAIDKFYEWAAFIKNEEQLATSERKRALKFINVSNLDRYVIRWGKDVRAFKKRLARPYLIYDDIIGKNKWRVFEKKTIVIKGTALELTAAYDDVGYANLSLYAVLFDENHNDLDAKKVAMATDKNAKDIALPPKNRSSLNVRLRIEKGGFLWSGKPIHQSGSSR
jgi:type I restriction-modification system DNA methylase subunit